MTDDGYTRHRSGHVEDLPGFECYTLECDETGRWFAVVNGWWVAAIDQSNADRIVDATRMAASVGHRHARGTIAKALGLEANGHGLRPMDRGRM